ncbi:hypothetical protein AYO20_08692 [Fonsecaea nubica]|uniref:Uncharacterized protein n=1 Tax=Fonsecaea nubica TaxID=856822 RepID=A0A178CNV1_9EURO|nr:hypothetical protein AYO20_08692 [Fonsecaea nubica]OAL30605.1 hypothetical protein AYO20_08692 [Fonsecaea nubica]
MCVRTKTSYGCGCEYKTTAKCHSSHCLGLERYHYPKSGDCRACKEAGSAVTRGRDGQGRYGQEINRRRHSREDDEASIDELPGNDEVGDGISPWAPPSAREKEWNSHSRQKADDAWLQEHAERNLDLQSIRESLPDSPPSGRGSPTHHPSRRQHTRIYLVDDDVHYARGDSHERRHRHEESGRSLPVEIRSRSVYRRRRQDSQDSFDSLRSSRSSARKHTPAPTTYTAYEYNDVHDSGYGGSYGSRASNGYRGAKTEPYAYPPSSPPPRVVSIKSPSPHSYTPYGVGPVNIVTRAPMYGYSPPRY